MKLEEERFLLQLHPSRRMRPGWIRGRGLPDQSTRMRTDVAFVAVAVSPEVGG